jgi:predicted Rossmann fold flavoprotein
MFPITDNSQSVIDVLLNEADKLNIKVQTGSAVSNIEKVNEGFEITVNKQTIINADKIIFAGGGLQKTDGIEWLLKFGHSITPTAPSLFTFNLPKEPITELMGVSVPRARVKITGTKLTQEGPLLITHWGLSGPAILKTSAWGARLLNEKGYDFKFLISWNADFTIDALTEELLELKQAHSRKKIINDQPEGLPKRLWEYLLFRAGISHDLLWADLSKKQLNALVNALAADEYHAKGKTTFKEEFVTCGGLDLGEVDFKSLQSKLVKGLYFAGEALDIDGVTGGFNFQAAWTTGYLAGKHAGSLES